MGTPIRMPLPKRFTVQEYLMIERKAEAKREFQQGQILAMAGGPPEHNSIAPSIIMAIGPQLHKKGCRFFSSDQRIAVANGEAAYYPDLSLTCGELKFFNRKQDVINNPVLVAEVLSRSTARYDRLVKVPLYKRTQTLQDILLVAQDRPYVEHFARDGEIWNRATHSKRADVVELALPGCSLALADIYRIITF